MWSWISPFGSNTTDTNNNGDENTNTNDFDFETELLEAELSSEENDWEIIGDSEDSNMPVNAQNKATEIQQNEPLLPLLIEKDLSIFTCNETNMICKDWAILSTPEEQEREEQLMQQLQIEQQVHFEQQQYLEEQLENVLSFEEELRQKELYRQEEQLRQQQKAKQQNQLLQQQLKEQQQLVLESQLELEKQQATQKAFLEKLQLEEEIRKEEQLMFEEQLKRDQEQHRLLEQQKANSQPKNDNQLHQQMDFIAISRPSQALQFLATTDLGYSEQPTPIIKKKQKKNLNSRKRKRKKGKSKQLAAATLSSKSNRTVLNRAAKRHIVQKRAANVDSKAQLTISRRFNHTNAPTTSNQLLLNNAFVDEKVLATRHKETTHQLKVYVNSQTITKPSKKSSRKFNNSSKNNNRNKVLFKKQSHRSSYGNTRNL